MGAWRGALTVPFKGLCGAFLPEVGQEGTPQLCAVAELQPTQL